jgi:hypothetical protein
VDWIDSFMTYTEGQPTPVRFRRWAAISAVAAALERRVWTITMGKPTFPNLYVLLVGPPTAGKTVAIDIVYDFWREAKCFHIAPKGMTTAALVDSLKEADRKQLIGQTLVEYHSLLVAIPEFGTFIHAHDLEMLANLNDIWDSPRTYGQKRRHNNGGKTIEIIHPQLNILGGAQPGFLASMMPEEAWSMGFTSRLLLIYGQEAPLVSLFSGKTLESGTHRTLLADMVKMAKAHGQFQWTPEAANEIERWHMARLAPEPTHSRLANYVGRRVRQFLKLLMVSAISRSIHEGVELIIRLEDVERAREWLLEAEGKMPDVFREMKLKSDVETIKELHFACWQKFTNSKQQMIHSEFLYSFLSDRAPSEKIERIIDTAVKSGYLELIAPGLYKPKALTNFGPE